MEDAGVQSYQAPTSAPTSTTLRNEGHSGSFLPPLCATADCLDRNPNKAGDPARPEGRR